jgi:hypothetical protein
MKNKIKYVGLLTCLFLVGMSGCKKDWLTPTPLSIYSPENTFVDKAGITSGLAACARNLRDEYFGDGSPIITENIFSDISVEGTDDKTGPAQNMDMQIRPDAQLNNPDFNRIGWYWDQQWIGIRLANTLISRIPKATAIPDADKNILLGQAYFYRAFDYYRLTNQFGDVPCPLKEISSAKVDFATVKRDVILTRMKQDLDFAVQYVPWVTDKGAVNRGACYHLLAKINLALGNFDDAIAAANAVINNGTFKMVTTRFGVDAGIAKKNVTWDLHRPDNKGLAANTEVLFLVTDRTGNAGAFNITSTSTQGTRIMRQACPGISIGTNIITPSGKAGASASGGLEIDIMNLYGRGIGRCRSTPYEYKDIWDDAKDYRHDSVSGNYMYMENVPYYAPALKTAKDTAYGLRMRLYAGSKLLCVDTLRSWFPWPHYKLYVPDLDNNPMQGGHSDWYVFRLAETYLLRAEAYIWKGDFASATADINVVRSRANCTPYTTANVKNIDAVLDERARELYWEEPRKTELTRIAYLFAKTGKAAPNGKTYSLTSFSTDNYFYDRLMDKNIFYKTNFVTLHNDMFKISPYHVLWPIPQAAILGNSEGRINQNIGYTGAELNVVALDKIPD